MEPSLFVPLGEQEHLKEFFNTMRENGRKDAAEDMEQLIACVKEMQEDLSDAMEEIDFLQQQIKDISDSGRWREHFASRRPGGRIYQYPV